MNYYRCPTCGTVFSEAELTTMKCSENYVGPEFSDICPKCLNRRKNKRFSRVKKIEDMTCLTGAKSDTLVAKPVIQEDKTYEIHCGDMTYPVSAKAMAKAIEAELYKEFNFMKGGA